MYIWIRIHDEIFMNDSRQAPKHMLHHYWNENNQIQLRTLWQIKGPGYYAILFDNIRRHTHTNTHVVRVRHSYHRNIQ